MKKLVALFVTVFVLATAICVFAMNSFALTQDGDWYEIASAEDLLEFKSIAVNGSKAKLTADIDMNGVEWTPFSNIVLQFDGQGHTISNLHLDGHTGTSGSYGLFADRITNGPGNSTIQNITFKDCSFTPNMGGGGTVVGFVVGNANRGAVYDITLDNCHLNLKGTAGEVRGGMILGSTEWGHGSWNWFDGGEGTAVGGYVKDNCTFTVDSNATIETPRFGGILGASNYPVYFVRAHFKGTITGPSGSRIASYASDVWNKVAFYDCELDDNTYAKHIEWVSGGTTLAAASAKGYNEAITNINNGKFGTGQHLYIMSDIDFGGEAIVPLSVGYVGKIDGRGYTFSNINLTLNDVTSGNHGLIANTLTNGPSGTVTNLTIANSEFTVNAGDGANGVNIGGIAGHSNRGTVSNCTLKNVTITANGEFGKSYVGGIIANAHWSNADGKVAVSNNVVDENCLIQANGSDVRVGGIVGFQDYDALLMTNCTNYGTVIGASYSGGLIAENKAGGSAINNCANYGSVTGKYASAVASWASNLTLTNVVAGGILTTVDGSVSAYGEWGVSVGDGCSAPCVTNPLSTENFSLFYQTANATASTVSVRVLIVADLAHLETIAADAKDVAVKIVFTLKDESTKVFELTLADYEICKKVVANNDTYTAADGDCIFGAVVTDVPFEDIATVGVVIETAELDILDVSAPFTK